MTGTILELSDESFDREVLQAEGPVLVDFWAPWCGPCRMQAPMLEEWAQRKGEAVKVTKLNTEDVPDVAARYGIRSIPTIVVFQGGQPVLGAVGVQSPENLDRLVDEAARKHTEKATTA